MTQEATSGAAEKRVIAYDLGREPMWLDWRPVTELTDAELDDQSHASLAFTNRPTAGLGTLAHEEWAKVLARGFAIDREVRNPQC